MAKRTKTVTVLDDEYAGKTLDAALTMRRHFDRARREFDAADRRLQELGGIEASALDGPDAWRHAEDEALFERMAAMEDIREHMDALGEEMSAMSAACANLVGSRTTRKEQVEDVRHFMELGGPYDGEEPWRRSRDLACPACGAMVLLGPLEGEFYCARCRRLVSEPETVPEYCRTRRSVKDFEKS